MPRYFLNIPSAPYSGTFDLASDLASPTEAWAETISICADLIGGVSRGLRENTVWQIELLDESKAPLFRIHLTTEAVSGVVPA